MPNNNVKLISTDVLSELNAKYTITYNANEQAICVTAGTKRVTKHDIDKPFHINSKHSPKRKVCFSIETISIWLTLQSKTITSKYTLFDVHNACIALKLMYHKRTANNVIDYLRSNFKGVKKI